MQLKSLHIDSYRHLQNLDFDFTYPEGHVKFGQPLEKVCIIGQSATGKTGILELVKDSFSKLNGLKTIQHKFFADEYQLSFNGKIAFLSSDDGLLELKDKTITKDKKEYINGHEGGEVNKLLNGRLKLIYLSSDVISKEAINIFNQNPLNIITELSKEQYAGFQLRYNSANYIYEFGHEVNQELWFSLLDKILDYRKRFNQMASELLNKGLIGDLNKLNSRYATWSETNENPLITFANKFNPVLNRLNLEIDLINTEYPIPIKSKNKDEIIPVAALSTGTKQLLLSMFPLFELDTSHSIILIDEPERSLFPDMQIDLISHYQRLAPNAQFIVATHSPFIAAAFEPEERFILYFNEEGEVAVRRGESPRGDDPNDILTNDFNVSYYNEFGKAAYKEYLNMQRKAKQEKEPEEKKKLVVEMAKLGNKYNF
ncbi:MAG: ATP-binding protein [Bacteroidota bacterium]|nr:ATP-binding protein [Bacteroidota bacterium]